MPKKRHAKGSGSDERERLLRLLRLTASDQDGEALAALRRAARLMERLEFDWEGLLRGAPPAADVLARAVALTAPRPPAAPSPVQSPPCPSICGGR